LILSSLFSFINVINQIRFCNKDQTTPTYDNVEFGVDVDELSFFVDDGQRRNSFVDKLPERLDDRHRVVADLDVLITADAQVHDRFRKVFRLRQVVNLEKPKQSIFTIYCSSFFKLSDFRRVLQKLK
jgi:hypothetical protein